MIAFISWEVVASIIAKTGRNEGVTGKQNIVISVFQVFGFVILMTLILPILGS